MEMLLKGAEACRAVPAEHAKITAALGAFARSAITGGSTMANPIVSPLGFTSSSTTTSSSLNSAVRVLPTTSSSSSNDEGEKDPFLLESLGLALSVPIIPKSDSVKKAEASYQSSIANDSLPKSSTVGITESTAPVCMFQSPSPKKDFQAMNSVYTPPLLTSCNTGDDDGYNSPAHTVSVDTDLGLERNEEEQEEITLYKDLASPPKAVLKTTSKAARVSDFIKHPSVSALKAPFTPLALSSLSSKTPLTTHRTVSRPDTSKVSATFLASPQPLQTLAAVMATPAVLLSARRVPISSVKVPKTAKQFWEIEEEEGMASNDAADNVETDCTNKIEDDEEKGVAIFSAASGTTPATTGRAQRVFATTPAQASLISSTTKASSRKKAKNTPAAGADSARRRSARLAGVSTAKTVEDENEDGENGMDSLNSSLMRLAVSTLGYTQGDE
jgi:hypothetical protein